MSQNDPIPDMAKGQAIKADWLNKVKRAATRTTLLPGMFQSGDLLLQARQKGGGGSSTTDLVIGIWQESVLAATSTAEADREEGSCKFYELASGGLIETATGENPQPVGFSSGNVGLFQRITTGSETKYIYIVPWCGFLAGSDDEEES